MPDQDITSPTSVKDQFKQQVENNPEQVTTDLTATPPATPPATPLANNSNSLAAYRRRVREQQLPSIPNLDGSEQGTRPTLRPRPSNGSSRGR